MNLITGTGFEQHAHFRISIPIRLRRTGQWSGAIEFFVFMGPKGRDYTPEYKELCWFQKDSVSMGLAEFFCNKKSPNII